MPTRKLPFPLRLAANGRIDPHESLSFGIAARVEMARQQMTVVSLVHRTGLGAPTVRRAIKGFLASADTVDRIAEVLGINLNEVLGLGGECVDTKGGLWDFQRVADPPEDVVDGPGGEEL